MNELLAQAIKGNRSAQKVFETMIPINELWDPAIHTILCSNSMPHEQCNTHRQIKERWEMLR